MSKEKGKVILLLGGTGKVARNIAPLLKQHGHHALIASRRGTAPEGYTGRQFDWLDEATYGPVLEEAAQGKIDAVFLVAPPVADAVSPMKRFIDGALAKGVRRVVLLSASVFEKGGPAMGQVHLYLTEVDVEYAVLRPSWFMENFAEMKAVRFDAAKGELYSATGEGKVPFVSAKDIAAVGYRALIDEVAHNTDHLVLGPELLSYDDAAQIFTEVLGRRISHVNLPEEEIVKRFQAVGLEEGPAKALGMLEGLIERGGEERLSDAILKVTGQKPMTLREWAEANKSLLS